MVRDATLWSEGAPWVHPRSREAGTRFRGPSLRRRPFRNHQPRHAGTRLLQAQGTKQMERGTADYVMHWVHADPISGQFVTFSARFPPEFVPKFQKKNNHQESSKSWKLNKKWQQKTNSKWSTDLVEKLVTARYVRISLLFLFPFYLAWSNNNYTYRFKGTHQAHLFLQILHLTGSNLICNKPDMFTQSFAHSVALNANKSMDKHHSTALNVNSRSDENHLCNWNGSHPF